MYERGLLPLSADPVTAGHLDLIKRAALECRELIVLVCDNDQKRDRYLFSLSERQTMLKQAVHLLDLPHVRVRAHESLLADAFLANGCDALFRGIRTPQDRTEDEAQMRYHALICPGIDTRVVYLEATPAFKDISSTLIKAFVSHDVDVSPWVPVFVKAALEERLRGHWKMAVTGEIASGKTWVTKRLSDTLRARGYKTHIINFDELVRALYMERSPGAQLVRERLAELCGRDVLTPDRQGIERGRLAERLFHPDTRPSVRQAAHACAAPQVMRLYREALRHAQGIVLVEWAQLAEMDMAMLTNHRSLVIQSPERRILAEERGLTNETLNRLSAFQWPADRKAAALEDQARSAGGGMILRFENRRGDGASPSRALSALTDAVLEAVPPSFKKNRAGDA